MTCRSSTPKYLSANGVLTARGLAKVYGAIANGDRMNGHQFLSAEVTRGLTANAAIP